MMRLFSSSKRSARVIWPDAAALGGGGERVADGGGLWAGRMPEAGPLGSPAPRG
jgi:hypothetical protein